MGTAIVASAGAGLPLDLPGLRTACAAVWALAFLALVTVLGARTLHWTHHRDHARTHLLDPAVAPFHGCLSMALLAVGGGALVVGRDRTGLRAALALDVVLFGAGTVTGLAAAVAVPYPMIVRHRIDPAGITPVLLLPPRRAHGVRRARPAAGPVSAGRAGPADAAARLSRPVSG